MSAPEPGGTENYDLIVPVDPAHDTMPLWPTTVSWQTRLASRHRTDCGNVPIKLSILMCVYNEERTILRAISEVLAVDYPCEMELIVLDDGSTDATPKLLEDISDPRLIIRQHPSNHGKGAALLSAAAMAQGTHILPFDADLEYSADDITRIIYPVLKGRCDVVYGARLFGFNTVYRSYRYAMGNRILTRMANILFNAYLSDLHTCLKLIPLTTFRKLDLREPGFGLDTEVTALLLKSGIRPFEVPVSYYGRSHDEGKKINWRDAVVCIAVLLRVRLRRRSRTRPAVIAGAGWRTVRTLEARDKASRGNATVTS